MTVNGSFGVTQSAIHYALPRLGVSYKKTLQHPKTNQQARLNFQQKIKAYQQADNPIVYLDESGFAQEMPRTHGYSKKATRCYRTQDCHAGGRVNVMGALMGLTFLTVALFDGRVTWLIQDTVTQNTSRDGDCDGQCQLSPAS